MTLEEKLDYITGMKKQGEKHTPTIGTARDITSDWALSQSRSSTAPMVSTSTAMQEGGTPAPDHQHGLDVGPIWSMNYKSRWEMS